jgi:hypothetical protein
LSLGHANDWRPRWPVVIRRLLVKIVEESAQLVKIMLRGWIELIVLTYRVTNGKHHKRGSERFRAFSRDVAPPSTLWV